MLPLVCLRVGLLRMRPRPVAAALTPGVGVLFTLAVATRPGVGRVCEQGAGLITERDVSTGGHAARSGAADGLASLRKATTAAYDEDEVAKCHQRA